MVKGTYYISLIGGETTAIRSLIQRRRLQLLVHSHIYYRYGTSLVLDKQWDLWAKDLIRLQNKYPKISEAVDYYNNFKDFDGNTGYNLLEVDGYNMDIKAKNLLYNSKN